MKQVTVRWVDGPGFAQLEVAPPELDLGSGAEPVTWVFVGIPNDGLPGVVFLTGGPGMLGPFASLRTTRFQIVAEGRSGAQGTFKYQAQLFQPGKGIVALSESVAVTAMPEKVDPSPTVVVRPGENGSLVVLPEKLELWSGDTVTWLFRGFEGLDWYPRIVFTAGPGELVSIGLGPFDSLTRHVSSIVGSGNGGPLGLYHYLIEVVDAKTDSVLFQTDPALANNGDPPGG